MYTQIYLQYLIFYHSSGIRLANLLTITKPDFLKKSWRHSSDYLFSANDTICTLGAAEMPKAMMGMPLACVPSNGGFSLVAVLGLGQNSNYFLNADGEWRGSYIPAAYRAYPFVLAESSSNEKGTALCIYTDGGHLIDNESEEPFFDQDLELSQSVREILDLVSSQYSDRKASDMVCKKLSELDLIKPWEVKLQLGDEEREIRGLFRIDDAALNGVSDAGYADLRAIGAIPYIYCQLLSMQRVGDLGEVARENFALHGHDELGFDGIGADGNISFDNL